MRTKEANQPKSVCRKSVLTSTRCAHNHNKQRFVRSSHHSRWCSRFVCNGIRIQAYCTRRLHTSFALHSQYRAEIEFEATNFSPMFIVCQRRPRQRLRIRIKVTRLWVCVLWLRLRCALHFGYGILPDALRLRMRFYWRYGEIELDKTADCCRMSTMFCANDDGNDYFNFRAAIFSQQYNNGAMCILIALWPNGQYSTQLVHWSKWDEKQCYFLIDIAWLVRILSAHPYIVASLFAWSNRIRSICVEYQTNNKFSEDRMLMAIIKANMYK